MALEACFETFFANETERLVEREDARDGSRVVVLMLAPEALSAHRIEAPMRRRLRPRAYGLPSAIGERNEGDAWNRRKTLLSSGHDGVEPPPIHLDRHRAQRDDCVDDREGPMLAGDASDLGKLAIEHPARRLSLGQ